jgi:hypothetical protein
VDAAAEVPAGEGAPASGEVGEGMGDGYMGAFSGGRMWQESGGGARQSGAHDNRSQSEFEIRQWHRSSLASVASGVYR